MLISFSILEWICNDSGYVNGQGILVINGQGIYRLHLNTLIKYYYMGHRNTSLHSKLKSF